MITKAITDTTLKNLVSAGIINLFPEFNSDIIKMLGGNKPLSKCSSCSRTKQQQSSVSQAVNIFKTMIMNLPQNRKNDLKRHMGADQIVMYVNTNNKVEHITF